MMVCRLNSTILGTSVSKWKPALLASDEASCCCLWSCSHCSLCTPLHVGTFPYARLPRSSACLPAFSTQPHALSRLAPISTASNMPSSTKSRFTIVIDSLSRRVESHASFQKLAVASPLRSSRAPLQLSRSGKARRCARRPGMSTVLLSVRPPPPVMPPFPVLTAAVPALSLPCSVTRSKDIKYECERYGKVLCVERDARARCALVEFDRWATWGTCSRLVGKWLWVGIVDPSVRSAGARSDNCCLVALP